MKLHICDEMAPLKRVLLGRADQLGPLPQIEDLYDPKSKAHLLGGTYPKEAHLVEEIESFKAVFEKYGVEVMQPESLKDCNQIFARDLGFVIDDVFVQSNILPLRERELEGLNELRTELTPSQLLYLNESVHVEGGDVILMGDHIFVGICTRPDYANLITARTNRNAFEALQTHFPHKQFHSIELNKSDNPYLNALHLDCVFQPVGHNLAILHPEGFANRKEYLVLKGFFDEKNIFEISADEMFEMTSNVFSIAPDIVVSDPLFDRLNHWLKEKGITVEEVSFRETAKQEGLFRCSTLPLERQSL